MLVEAIFPLLPNDNAGLSWANGAVDAILSSYQDSRVEDVPTLIRLAAQHAALALILKYVIFHLYRLPSRSDIVHPVQGLFRTYLSRQSRFRMLVAFCSS